VSCRHLAAAGACVLAVVAAGCSVSAQGSPKMTADDAVPFGLLKPDAPALVPPVSAPVTESVALCFVEDGRLGVVQRSLDAVASLSDVVEALTEPPTTAGASLTTALSPSLVVGVRLQGGVVQIDLSPAVSALGGSNQLLAVAQLVCTLTARPGVGQITFTVSSAPVDVPRGDGSLTADPVSRDDYATLLP